MPGAVATLPAMKGICLNHQLETNNQLKPNNQMYEIIRYK
jgi:hypothetical protein